MEEQETKEIVISNIMHTEMGFSYGSFYAMGDTVKASIGEVVTILARRRDGERVFCHLQTEGKTNLYGWINSDHLRS